MSKFMDLLNSIAENSELNEVANDEVVLYSYFLDMSVVKDSRYGFKLSVLDNCYQINKELDKREYKDSIDLNKIQKDDIDLYDYLYYCTQKAVAIYNRVNQEKIKFSPVFVSKFVNYVYSKKKEVYTYAKKYQLISESVNPNSPENRVLEFCVRTDYKTKQYDIEISDSSSLDDVLTMIHFMIRDIDRKQASVPFDNDYLVENYKRWCKDIVEKYNLLQHYRDDNEKKPKNFAKVTLTKKFIVDFCNLIWEKRDYIKKIKK